MRDARTEYSYRKKRSSETRDGRGTVPLAERLGEEEEGEDALT